MTIPEAGDHVVASTGPRSLQTADRPTCARAVAAIQDAIAELHNQHGDRLVLMSGMAEGWDSLIAWAALRSRIRLWCAVPHRTYGAYYWGRRSLTGLNRANEYTSILNRAWRRTFVMEDTHHTGSLHLGGVHANMIRNQWMVDVAHEFLAWNAAGSRGTADCVARIQAAGKPWRDLSTADGHPRYRPEPLFTITPERTP